MSAQIVLFDRPSVAFVDKRGPETILFNSAPVKRRMHPAVGYSMMPNQDSNSKGRHLQIYQLARNMAVTVLLAEMAKGENSRCLKFEQYGRVAKKICLMNEMWKMIRSFTSNAALYRHKYILRK